MQLYHVLLSTQDGDTNSYFHLGLHGYYGR